MFKRRKKQNKEFEFNLRLIEKIGTLETQNKFLHDKIKKLEQRVTDLEIARKVGF
jgi:hypothetical protein